MAGAVVRGVDTRVLSVGGFPWPAGSVAMRICGSVQFQLRCTRITYVQRVINVAKRDYHVDRQRLGSFDNYIDKDPASRVERVVAMKATCARRTREVASWIDIAERKASLEL
ncbi:uncharacterized protein ARMOST_07943 [Armillaria ostoyae]|uniref:Uncharacterized protein n=1 Tax=Armillaria ostoyae TaxID=47428 RepID=A0A284R784_ARMOS|nr:uncharacterized protein ARMOST_07943 [Armillaria ostoyae]